MPVEHRSFAHCSGIVRVAAALPLSEARRAHEQLAAGGYPGKIVLLF
jgi:hypothetical protein